MYIIMEQNIHANVDEGRSELDNRIAVDKNGDCSANGTHDEKKYRCTFSGCTAAFLRPSRLARHARLHTGERPFKCTYPGCDRTYTNSSHLKRHAESHGVAKKTYRCSRCSLTISNLHNLKRHYDRVHNEHNRPCCKVCNLSFSKKHQLARHAIIHTGVVPYECEKCNKSFVSIARLKRHREMHKTKSYPCTVVECSEVFEKWATLNAHIKAKHVVDHKCVHCEKVFLSKAHLKVHSVVHSEKRSVIACPYNKCHRVYHFKRNLDHHIRCNHIGEKYHCDVCGLGFSTKQKLTKHIMSLHQMVQRKKTNKRPQRKKRKDAGVFKKSMITALIGVQLPTDVEKVVLQREPRINISQDYKQTENVTPGCIG